MRNAWSWLGLNLGKRAGTVTVIGLLVTLVLGLGITQLSFRTSNSSYLNGNDKAQVENEAYSQKFGGDPIAAMFTMEPGKTVDDLFTRTNALQFWSIEQQLLADPSVSSFVTPLDSVLLANTLAYSPSGNPTTTPAGQLLLSAEERDPSPQGKAARLADIQALLALESKIPLSERNITNPAWVIVLVHTPTGAMRPSSQAFLPNDTHASAIIFLKGDLTIDQEAAAYQSVQNIFATARFENVQGGYALVTGVPALLQTINDYLKHGLLTLSALAALIMIIILSLFFTVRWRLLPFLVVSVGLIWAFGLVGYLGIPLTLGSIAGLPVLLGVGMDYAIQLHSRVEEEVVLDRADHPIQATARNLGPALLVVTFDAVFAFLALTLAKVPLIRQFGWLLVVGIIAVCIAGIILPLAILGIREYKSPTKGKDYSKGRLSRAVVWLGSVPAKAAIPLMVGALVVFAAGILVEGSLQLQTDPLQWVDPNSPTVHDIAALKAGTGTENAVSALVTTDAPYSDATADYVTNYSYDLQKQYPNELFEPTGVYNQVAEFLEVPGASVVAPTGNQVKEVVGIAPYDIQHAGVSPDGHDVSLFFRSKTATLGDLQPVVTTMQNDAHPPTGITLTPGGIAVVGVGLIENLSASRTLLTYLALLFVGIFLAIRLRSVIRSLLSLVPVFVAVGAVSLVAWMIGLKLSPLTAVSGPLVVAVCTEFTSLILLRFVEERGRGLQPVDAMAVTASRTGRAFMVSGFTAIAGVLTIASSPWPLLRGFGLIVGLNLAVALLCALVILHPSWCGPTPTAASTCHDGSSATTRSRGRVRTSPSPSTSTPASPPTTSMTATTSTPGASPPTSRSRAVPTPTC